MRKRALSSCTFMVSPCADSVIALIAWANVKIHTCDISANSTAFVTITLLYLVGCYSQWGSQQLLRKDTSKNCLDIGHPSPLCPHLVSDLSLVPFLISQGIKATLPLFSCCQRVAVAYGHFIVSVNSAQRHRCSHANMDLSDWAIFHHANSRWGRLLSLQDMRNLHHPDHLI